MFYIDDCSFHSRLPFPSFSHKPDQIETFSFTFFRSFTHSISIIMLWCRAFIKIPFSCHCQTYCCFTILIMWIYSIIYTEKFIHHSIYSLYSKLLNRCVFLNFFSPYPAVNLSEQDTVLVFFEWFWLRITCCEFQGLFWLNKSFYRDF
jgi:hypothetical protein